MIYKHCRAMVDIARIEDIELELTDGTSLSKIVESLGIIGANNLYILFHPDRIHLCGISTSNRVSQIASINISDMGEYVTRYICNVPTTLAFSCENNAHVFTSGLKNAAHIKLTYSASFDNHRLHINVTRLNPVRTNRISIERLTLLDNDSELRLIIFMTQYNPITDVSFTISNHVLRSALTPQSRVGTKISFNKAPHGLLSIAPRKENTKSVWEFLCSEEIELVGHSSNIDIMMEIGHIFKCTSRFDKNEFVRFQIINQTSTMIIDSSVCGNVMVRFFVQSIDADALSQIYPEATRDMLMYEAMTEQESFPEVDIGDDASDCDKLDA